MLVFRRGAGYSTLGIVWTFSRRRTSVLLYLYLSRRRTSVPVKKNIIFSLPRSCTSSTRRNFFLTPDSDARRFAHVDLLPHETPVRHDPSVIYLSYIRKHDNPSQTLDAIAFDRPVIRLKGGMYQFGKDQCTLRLCPLSGHVVASKNGVEWTPIGRFLRELKHGQGTGLVHAVSGGGVVSNFVAPRDGRVMSQRGASGTPTSMTTRGGPGAPAVAAVQSPGGGSFTRATLPSPDLRKRPLSTGPSPYGREFLKQNFFPSGGTGAPMQPTMQPSGRGREWSPQPIGHGLNLRAGAVRAGSCDAAPLRGSAAGAPGTSAAGVNAAPPGPGTGGGFATGAAPGSSGAAVKPFFPSLQLGRNLSASPMRSKWPQKP